MCMIAPVPVSVKHPQGHGYTGLVSIQNKTQSSTNYVQISRGVLYILVELKTKVLRDGRRYPIKEVTISLLN